MFYNNTWSLDISWRRAIIIQYLLPQVKHMCIPYLVQRVENLTVLGDGKSVIYYFACISQLSWFVFRNEMFMF